MVGVNNLLNEAFSRIGEKKIPSRRKIAKNNVPGKTTEKCEIYFRVSRSWWQLCSGLKVDLKPSYYNCPVINALTCLKTELWPNNRIKWSSRMLKSFFNSFKSLRKAGYQATWIPLANCLLLIPYCSFLALNGRRYRGHLVNTLFA